MRVGVFVFHARLWSETDLWRKGSVVFCDYPHEIARELSRISLNGKKKIMSTVINYFVGGRQVNRIVELIDFEISVGRQKFVRKTSGYITQKCRLVDINYISLFVFHSVYRKCFSGEDR